MSVLHRGINNCIEVHSGASLRVHHSHSLDGVSFLSMAAQIPPTSVHIEISRYPEDAPLLHPHEEAIWNPLDYLSGHAVTRSLFVDIEKISIRLGGLANSAGPSTSQKSCTDLPKGIQR